MAVEVALTAHLKSFATGPVDDWEPLLHQAALVDEAGYDRLVVSDHIVFGEHMEAYGRPELGGLSGGTQPTGPDGPWLEPLTTLAVIAGRTSRVRLGTAILLAALRRPVVLAKAAATLDVLSRGRLELGVSVGWQREEYEAAGLRFEERGALLDQTLEVCQKLWVEERASYASAGGELRFDAIHMQPKPRQHGGVPIWIGGSVNRRCVSRIARFGAGWLPWGPDREDIGGGISRMRSALSSAGRDPSDLRILGDLPVVNLDDGSLDTARTVERIRDLIGAGITDVCVRSVDPFNDPPDAWWHKQMVDAFRAATST